MDKKTWKYYVELASQLSDEAEEMMLQFINNNPNSSDSEIVNYAYGLVSRYGESNATLAAEIYDACARVDGADVATAEVVETPYADVAKTVYATLSSRENMIGAVGRLVKRAGADTTLHNALRDGAEFAWIPSGDTCSFCIMLASRGWQKASKKSIKNGHAEHIHSHCDCQYAVRFDSKTNVEGYDPDGYLRQYRDAGSDINAMRRDQYANNRATITAQHRAAYAKKHQRNLPYAMRAWYNGQEILVPINSVISSVTTLAGGDTGIAIRDIKRLVASYGGAAEDWLKQAGKIESDRFTFDMHWYENGDGFLRDLKIKKFVERK